MPEVFFVPYIFSSILPKSSELLYIFYILVMIARRCSVKNFSCKYKN